MTTETFSNLVLMLGNAPAKPAVGDVLSWNDETLNVQLHREVEPGKKRFFFIEGRSEGDVIMKMVEHLDGTRKNVPAVPLTALFFGWTLSERRETENADGSKTYEWTITNIATR